MDLGATLLAAVYGIADFLIGALAFASLVLLVWMLTYIVVMRTPHAAVRGRRYTVGFLVFTAGIAVVTGATWLLIDVPLSTLSIGAGGGVNPGAYIAQHLAWYVARVADCIAGVPLSIAVLLCVHDFFLDPLTRPFGRPR